MRGVVLSGDDRRDVMMDYALKYGCDTFVETGTSSGESLHKALRWAKHIYSCDVAQDRVQAQINHFLEHTVPQTIDVQCVESPEFLNQILPLPGRVLFWLDAHSDGPGTPKGVKETPVLEELAVIVREQPDSIILIDDSWLFGTDPYGNGLWPSLNQMLRVTGVLQWAHEDRDSIIRFVPRKWGR